MKRILILLLAMSMLVSVAFAVDGLKAGAGINIPDFDADDLDPIIEITVSYENDLTDQISLFSEIKFEIPTAEDVDPWMNLEIEGKYKLNPNFDIFLGYRGWIPFDDDYDATGWLVPGVRYNMDIMFFRLDLPMYLHGAGDAFDILKMDFTYNFMRLRDKGGCEGFGFEVALHCILDDPIESDFLQEMSITPYFENSLLYAEVEIRLPLMEDGFDLHGMTIIPEIEVNIPPVRGLSGWFNLPIRNIGADVGDTVIGMGLGVRYSF